MSSGFGGAPTASDAREIGIGYTLATGRLFCDISDFHAYAEHLLGRPVYTHEFGEESIWHRMRERYEAVVLAERTASEGGCR